jgi:hypothetical protein
MIHILNEGIFNLKITTLVWFYLYHSLSFYIYISHSLRVYVWIDTTILPLPILERRRLSTFNQPIKDLYIRIKSIQQR